MEGMTRPWKYTRGATERTTGREGERGCGKDSTEERRRKFEIMSTQPVYTSYSYSSPHIIGSFWEI